MSRIRFDESLHFRRQMCRLIGIGVFLIVMFGPATLRSHADGGQSLERSNNRGQAQTKVQEFGPVQLEGLVWRDAEGETIPLEPASFRVISFLGTECPLARLYGPRLQELADEFRDDGFLFLGVNSNLHDSPAEILDYARDHGIRFPIAKDADQSILTVLDAERTPEVFVIDESGWVRYRGRIDDQYEPGVAKSEPTQNDLREAMISLAAGKPVETPRTDGVGCLITRRPKPTPSHKLGPESGTASEVTFHREIAPILNAHCVECHRDGEIGPFALTDYDEVVGWGEMTLEVIDQRRMPPWHADPSVGRFVGERRMPTQDRDTIARWIDQGMPEGDAADQPVMPKWPSGWHVSGEPDVELEMRSTPFAVPANGTVDYQYYVVDPQWDEDRWVRAAQVIPGNPGVVHHAIVFVRPPDGSDFTGIGWLGAYVPGQRTALLPAGHARRIPAGSKLVFQMHYTPNGRPASDLSRVGVWFADDQEVTHEVATRVAINHDFEIPPGAAKHSVRMTLKNFGPQSKLLGVTPHMHLRGKSFELLARRTDDVQASIAEPLLRVPHYDFNWQHWYAFEESIDLDAVDAIEMEVVFDNSPSNPFNPAPDEYVFWGDQTWEEMAIAFFDVAQPLGLPKTSQRQRDKPSPEQVAARQRVVERRADAFLAEMDANGDGVVSRDETPVTFARFGFRKLDRSGDGVIDRDEILRSAAERP